MKKVILVALLALSLFGNAAAAAYVSPTTAYNIIVTVDRSTCGQVTVTAKGYGLSIDSAFALVAGRATKVATLTRDSNGVGSVTATFTLAETGENANATVRTRYGGYLAAGSQAYDGAPFTAAELNWFRVAAC